LLVSCVKKGKGRGNQEKVYITWDARLGKVLGRRSRRSQKSSGAAAIGRVTSRIQGKEHAEAKEGRGGNFERV